MYILDPFPSAAKLTKCEDKTDWRLSHPISKNIRELDHLPKDTGKNKHTSDHHLANVIEC